MQIAVDCSDPARLAEFWASVLDYEVLRVDEDGERAFVSDPAGTGPKLLFHRVPEPKAVKSRLHLDVYVSPWGSPPAQSKPIVDAEAERLGAMGATQLQAFEKSDDYFVVMSDPEGNEFCIA
ncbi:MAG TPA: VOC family protein [Mycobacteriales bacterium]|nr:VOC family protein [Mycobacteriales bacterium]